MTMHRSIPLGVLAVSTVLFAHVFTQAPTPRPDSGIEICDPALTAGTSKSATIKRTDIRLDVARAILRRELTPEQRSNWINCVQKQVLGVHIVFLDETATNVTMQLSYRGPIGTTTRVRLDADGGRMDDQYKTKFVGIRESQVVPMTIVRETPQSTITVSANSAAGQW